MNRVTKRVIRIKIGTSSRDLEFDLVTKSSVIFL